MENDRREYSKEQPAAAQPEPGFQEEPVHAERVDYDDYPHEPTEEPTEPGERSGPAEDPADPIEPRERGEDSVESGPVSEYRDEQVDAGSGASGPAQAQQRARARNRGRGRRPSPRDRRLQDRNRRRENRPSSFASGNSGDAQRRGAEPAEREARSESELPPETRSILDQAKAELEQIREVLEGVLRDLDHVSDQLTKAEHEKDIAEAEIEQLRESLRRLHR